MTIDAIIMPNAPTSPAIDSILIAGVGNVFHCDDAFGVEVVRRIARRALPQGVRAVDYGIRGFDLAYAIAGAADVILLDATRRGGAPGTLYALELDPAGRASGEIDTHAMVPENALRLAAQLGGTPRRVFLVGCEPSDVAFDAEREGLSPAVEAATAGAIELVMDLIERLRGGG